MTCARPSRDGADTTDARLRPGDIGCGVIGSAGSTYGSFPVRFPTQSRTACTTMPETVAIAADHAGFELKAALKGELRRLGYAVLDLGTHGTRSRRLSGLRRRAGARRSRDGKARRGVLICGTGIGISIAANRHRHVRAALCHDATERAAGARSTTTPTSWRSAPALIGVEVAKDCLRAFLTHRRSRAAGMPRRVAKLGCTLRKRRQTREATIQLPMPARATPAPDGILHRAARRARSRVFVAHRRRAAAASRTRSS